MLFPRITASKYVCESLYWYNTVCDVVFPQQWVTWTSLLPFFRLFICHVFLNLRKLRASSRDSGKRWNSRPPLVSVAEVKASSFQSQAEKECRQIGSHCRERSGLLGRLSAILSEEGVTEKRFFFLPIVREEKAHTHNLKFCMHHPSVHTHSHTHTPANGLTLSELHSLFLSTDRFPPAESENSRWATFSHSPIKLLTLLPYTLWFMQEGPRRSTITAAELWMVSHGIFPHLAAKQSMHWEASMSSTHKNVLLLLAAAILDDTPIIQVN